MMICAALVSLWGRLTHRCQPPLRARTLLVVIGLLELDCFDGAICYAVFLS